MGKYRALFVIVVVVALLAACSPEGGFGVVVGSGRLVTREESFRDFDRLDVGSAFEVNVRQGDSYQVTITVDENVVPYLDVAQVGSTLRIGLKPMTTVSSVTLRAEITMPELVGLELSGASRGRVNGFESSRDLTLGLSGAASLTADVGAGNVRIDLSGASSLDGSISGGDVHMGLSGASRVDLSGSGRNLTLGASGASHADLGGFPVQDASVEISGASTGRIDVSGRLEVGASGASHLSYRGTPTLGRIETSGASTIDSEN